MNMLLPDSFVRVTGFKVKVVIFDICPLREDYSLTPILLSVLRDLAQGTDIVIEHNDDILNEVSLTDKRIEDALAKSDADLLVFGSYVATHANVQPMIHILCSYGRAPEPGGGLPAGMELDQAIQEGDAILQMPRHILLRDILPAMSFETLTFQNTLAEEIFRIAQFIQAMKLYQAQQFEATVQMVDAILARLVSSEQWPEYWAPFSYLHMLSGLAYLRAGNLQGAMYTLSNAMARSTPAKMRVQHCAEQILSSLLQSQEHAAAAQPAAAQAARKPRRSKKPAQS